MEPVDTLSFCQKAADGGDGQREAQQRERTNLHFIKVSIRIPCLNGYRGEQTAYQSRNLEESLQVSLTEETYILKQSF